MFLKSPTPGLLRTRGGIRHDGAQWCHGYFLALVLLPDMKCTAENMRAIVGYARFAQRGHFMNGYFYVGKHKMWMEGAYGANGLPRDVSEEVYALATPVPRDLFDLWNKGGGHNSAGSEAQAMADWALPDLLPPHIKHRLRSKM